MRLPRFLIGAAVCAGVLTGMAPPTGHRTAAAADAPSTVALMRLLQSDRLPESRKAAVVELICNRGGPDDLATMLRRTTAGEFDTSLTLKVLNQLIDATEVRKVRPAGDLSAIVALVKPQGGKKSPAVRMAALRLAALWRTPGIAEELRGVASDAAAPAELREAAIEGLAAVGEPSAIVTLLSLAESPDAGAIRFRAAAALAKLNLDPAAPLAAQVLAAARTADDVGPVVDAFLVRKGGPEKLGAALAKVELPADAAKLALRHMYSVGRSDAALSDILSKAAGIAVDQPPPTAAELRQLLADIAARGNAERGEKVFRRSDLSCMKCHAVARAGGQVGPELTAIGSISPVDYVANSILVPNLAVKEQFVTRVFITDDGRTITGIVVDRDKERVNVRDATGALVTIPTADIDEEEEGKSLMPQGLTKFLTRDELIDLVKFVSELGKPGPYALRSVPTVQRWRVMKSISAEVLAEPSNVEYFRELVLAAPPEAWQPAYGTARGDLPLAELGRPGDTLLLQGEVNVVEAGDVAIVVQPRNAQLWIDAEPFDAAGGVERMLDKGVHRLTLRVKIDDKVSSARIEMSKPAASKAQFDVVGGS